MIAVVIRIPDTQHTVIFASCLHKLKKKKKELIEQLYNNDGTILTHLRLMGVNLAGCFSHQLGRLGVEKENKK